MLSHKINISHVVKKHTGFACLLMLGERCPLKTFRFPAVTTIMLIGGEFSKDLHLPGFWFQGAPRHPSKSPNSCPSSHKQHKNLISLLPEYLCFSEHSSLILSNVEKHSIYFFAESRLARAQGKACPPLTSQAKPAETLSENSSNNPQTLEREIQGTKGFDEKIIQCRIE